MSEKKWKLFSILVFLLLYSFLNAQDISKFQQVQLERNQIHPGQYELFELFGEAFNGFIETYSAELADVVKTDSSFLVNIFDQNGLVEMSFYFSLEPRELSLISYGKGGVTSKPLNDLQNDSLIIRDLEMINSSASNVFPINENELELIAVSKFRREKATTFLFIYESGDIRRPLWMQKILKIHDQMSDSR